MSSESPGPLIKNTTQESDQVEINVSDIVNLDSYLNNIKIA